MRVPVGVTQYVPCLISSAGGLAGRDTIVSWHDAVGAGMRSSGITIGPYVDAPAGMTFGTNGTAACRR